MSIDGNELDGQLEQVNRLLRAHAGGLEVVSMSAEGRLNLRYSGFCTGCPYRPLTTASTVRPMLMQVQGVTAVEIEGSRISEEAELRVARLLAKGWERKLSMAPSGEPGRARKPEGGSSHSSKLSTEARGR